jgi:hypothetical protein
MAGLPQLTWYDLLEMPPVSGDSLTGTSDASDPPDATPPRPASLTQLSGELVLRHLLDAENTGDYLPAVDLFACPRQLPYLEAATMVFPSQPHPDPTPTHPTPHLHTDRYIFHRRPEFSHIIFQMELLYIFLYALTLTYFSHV